MADRAKSNRIADREDEYHARRQRVLSPSRADAFALGDKTPDVSTRSYKDVMAEQQVAKEREELKRKLKVCCARLPASLRCSTPLSRVGSP